MSRHQMEFPPVEVAEWPDAAPSASEDKVVSVVCGNTHIHWAFHDGMQSNFTPTLFWRTPHLQKSELEKGPSKALSSYLPESAHHYIFGESDATKEDAIKTSRTRRVPEVSIYIVSSNQKQAEKVKYIWSEVPSRVRLLQGGDFFTKEEGRYDSMGVDRLAVLYAAASTLGPPALVFDGGTALTYSALGCDGKIMGGGISLGLGPKLRSLSESTGALPKIGVKELTSALRKAEKGEPMDTFASDTTSAMMVSSLSEIACSARRVIHQWLERVGPADPSQYKTTGLNDEGTEADKSGDAQMEKMKTGGVKITAGVEEPHDGTNKKRVVFVTGGDGDMLLKLLQTDHGGILVPDLSNNGPAQYGVHKMRHMIHLGIAAVLEKKARLRPKDPALESWEALLLGKRVAKMFPDSPQEDGDVVYRGTIHQVMCDGEDRSQDVFKIFYDDDDSEDVDANQLYELLLLYATKGEKAGTEIDASTAQERKDASKEAADILERECKSAEVSVKEPAPEAEKETLKETPPPAKAVTEEGPKKRPATESQKPKPAKKVRKLPHEPLWYTGKRVAKKFGKEVFFGTVDEYCSDLVEAGESGPVGPGWSIIYDDGDGEDFTEKELIKHLNYYEKWKKHDTSAPPKVKEGITEKTETQPPTEDVPDVPSIRNERVKRAS